MNNSPCAQPIQMTIRSWPVRPEGTSVTSSGFCAKCHSFCTPEHSTDAELSLQDLASYLHATGGRLNLGIGKQPNRVERIKELAICLESELKALADLSSNSDDRQIRHSINGFFGEAWFNFFKILCDATSRLPMEPEENSPVKLLGTDPGIANDTRRAEMAGC